MNCEWPFGDPGTPGFRFCGSKSLPGKPYCAAHCRRAYRRPGDSDNTPQQWTDNRVETLRRLFRAGASGHEIARRTGMSPTAANAKIRELGLR